MHDLSKIRNFKTLLPMMQQCQYGHLQLSQVYSLSIDMSVDNCLSDIMNILSSSDIKLYTYEKV